MSSLLRIYRLSNCVIGSFKTVFHGRVNWQVPIICTYTKKSAEQKLGIEKPKRPLTPFFKFMTQIRPALLAKIPGISTKEAIAWSSKHWQHLDAEAKVQMTKEYEKDKGDYMKIKAMYEASLTEEQKADIKRVREEMAESKEKRRQKAEYKELGRPKKPISSYFLFLQSRKDKFKGKNLKEFQDLAKNEWFSLPPKEKIKFEKQARGLLVKYKKEIEAWELKMVAQGRSDLVRAKAVREPKSKDDKKK